MVERCLADGVGDKPQTMAEVKFEPSIAPLERAANELPARALAGRSEDGLKDCNAFEQCGFGCATSQLR